MANRKKCRSALQAQTVREITKPTHMFATCGSPMTLRIYFNNHYGGKAVVNTMQFKEMIGVSLSEDEKRVMENAKGHILGS